MSKASQLMNSTQEVFQYPPNNPYFDYYKRNAHKQKIASAATGEPAPLNSEFY